MPISSVAANRIQISSVAVDRIAAASVATEGAHLSTVAAGGGFGPRLHHLATQSLHRSLSVVAGLNIGQRDKRSLNHGFHFGWQHAASLFSASVCFAGDVTFGELSICTEVFVFWRVAHLFTLHLG